MKTLEERILNNLKEKLPAIMESISKVTTKARYITKVIRSEHTFDQVTYDTWTKKFTKLTYIYWNGIYEHDNEHRTIDLTKIDFCN